MHLGGNRRWVPLKGILIPVCFFSAGLLKLDFNDTLVSSTHTVPVNIFKLEGGETVLARDKGNFHAQGQESNSRPSGSEVSTSELYSIRRVASSILAWGTKIFVVPGEHGFFSFQVENVHWKCMCAAH